MQTASIPTKMEPNQVTRFWNSNYVLLKLNNYQLHTQGHSRVRKRNPTLTRGLMTPTLGFVLKILLKLVSLFTSSSW